MGENEEKCIGKMNEEKLLSPALSLENEERSIHQNSEPSSTVVQTLDRAPKDSIIFLIS